MKKFNTDGCINKKVIHFPVHIENFMGKAVGEYCIQFSHPLELHAKTIVLTRSFRL